MLNDGVSNTFSRNFLFSLHFPVLNLLLPIILFGCLFISVAYTPSY